MNQDPIDKLMSRLQAQEPVLSDPDALTDSIMAALPERRQNPHIGVSRWLIGVRYITSVAASLLFLLFVWQSYDDAYTTPAQSSRLSDRTFESHYTQKYSGQTPRQVLASYQESKNQNASLFRTIKNFKQ